MKKIFLSTLISFMTLTDSFSQSDISVDFFPAKNCKTKFILHCISTGNLAVNEIKSSTDSLPAFQSLRLKSNPMLIYIYKNERGYSSILHNELKKYKIRVTGKEKINGYDCTKLSVITLKNGSCCSYVWVSNKVKDFKKLTELNIHGLDISKLYTAMDSLNIQGFPVRIEFVGDYSQIYDLNAIKFGDFSKSFAMFNSKEGYLDSLKRVDKITEQEYLKIKKEQLDAATTGAKAAMKDAKKQADDEAKKKANQSK